MKTKSSYTILFIVFFALIQCDRADLMDKGKIGDDESIILMKESQVRATNDHELLPGEYYFINKKYKTIEGVAIWKAQLDMTKRYISSSTQKNLKLLSYNYVKEVNNIDELDKIKVEIADKCTFFPKSQGNGLENITISESIHDKNKTKDLLDFLLPTSETTKHLIPKSKGNSQSTDSTYIFKEKDLGVVDIHWEYLGEEIITKCLVSESIGIVYDNFLYFIGFSEIGKMEQAPDPMFRTASIDSVDVDLPITDSTGVCEPGSIEKAFHIYGTVHNYYGILVCSY